MVTTSLKFTAFYDAIDKAIEESWGHTKTDLYLKDLARFLQELSQELITYGDENLNLDEDLTSSQILANKEVLIFYYHWVDAAKSFLILWRNILFENQKAYLLEKEGVLSVEGQLQLKADSRKSIEAARQELNACFAKAEQNSQIHNKRFLKQLEKWYKQDVPWPAYREQITIISRQAKELIDQHQLLNHTLSYVNDIRKLINKDIESCTSEVSIAMDMAVEGLSFIREKVEEQTAQIPTFLETLESKIPDKSHNKHFMRQLEQKLDRLSGENQVSTVIRGSAILQKDLHFKRDISRWLDSEILPILLEIWELNKQVKNSLKMALINIRNRALLITNEYHEDQNTELNTDGLCQPLNHFLQQSTHAENELSEHVQIIVDRLEAHFKLSAIFREEATFLSVPLQSTINQLRTNQNKLWENTKIWWAKQLKKIDSLLSRVQEEDALSTSEKIVRYIENRIPKASNQAYNSIFLTKGYIGESFWVGRGQELRRMKSIIQQWEQGYRGTVLLTANRFAGKSLFGDLISNRYFARNTIRLAPNSTILVDGRSFSTTYNLGEALAFISKNSIHSKNLIWLDDLELWCDTENTISQNTAQLQTHIDKYFGRVFYLVSLSNHLKEQLDKSHQLSRSFQAELRLNTMSLDEINEAIQIRHGATHKELVDKEGDVIHGRRFKKLTSRIYRNAQANIGEALNLWACNIEPLKGNKVISSAIPDYSFPDFLEADTALVLKILLLEKTSTEYRLRKRFGPAFNPNYSEALMRLLSLGMVKRQLDGWLEINELAVNDIIRLLRKHGYLINKR